MSLRPYHTRPIFFAYGIFFGILTLYYFRTLICTTYALLSLTFIWPWDASDFLISPDANRDAFDLSFANYSRTQDSAGPLYRDLVPPVLHHIALGSHKPQGKWIDARNACLELHPKWEAMLWTDENAGDFVREKFPELLHMWERYPYPIQRIDALRYLVLYEYGGEYSLLSLGSWGIGDWFMCIVFRC
jgi:mannosyltransferase OCH1-like enzyme